MSGLNAEQALRRQHAATYEADVRAAVEQMLNPRSRLLRWLLEPVAYTMARRRNFFRAAFSVTTGVALDRPEQGRLTGAAGEIGWTCALILDDLLDGSTEREGAPAAHTVFGAARAIAAVPAALALVADSGLRFSTLSWRVRAATEWLALRLLVQCLWSQRPERARSITIDSLSRRGRAVNNSTHWALLAPVCGDRGLTALRRELWRYADVTTVNAKLRNDLLDFYGGSSESDTRFKDFDSHRITFPIAVLLAQSLAPADREKLEGHFLHRRPSALGRAEMMDLLVRSGGGEQCLALMRRNALEAEAAAAGVESACPGEDGRVVAALMRGWTAYIIDGPARRMGAEAASVAESIRPPAGAKTAQRAETAALTA